MQKLHIGKNKNIKSPLIRINFERSFIYLRISL
nr:MAG TPA: hypothetical protein [Caudoviricetes sp.]